MPLVFIYRPSCTKPKSLNSLSWSYCFMPIPLSTTSTSRKSAKGFWQTPTLIVTWPFSVNLRAFDWMFSKICMIRCSSERIIGLTRPGAT